MIPYRSSIITLILIFVSAIGCAQDEVQTEANEPVESKTDTLTVNAKEFFDWVSLEKAQQMAAENDKKVLIYANAAWCTYCKKMEKEVFSLESVQEVTDQYFYPVWLDIESEDSLRFRDRTLTEIEFARAMRVTGTPTFIFLDQEGEIIAGQPGYIPEDLYLQILEFIGSSAYEEQSFEEYAGG